MYEIKLDLAESYSAEENSNTASSVLVEKHDLLYITDELNLIKNI